jgi:thioredoxin 1
MAESTLHLTEASFDAELGKHRELLMVDCWAEWCAPCRAIAPALDELARDSAGKVSLAKVNVDEHPGLAARYGVRSIPPSCSSRTARWWIKWSAWSPKPSSEEAGRHRLNRGVNAACGPDTPTLAIARRVPVAGRGNLVPIYAELAADLDAAVRVPEAPGAYAFCWSRSKAGRSGRFSFLGSDPLMVFPAKGNGSRSATPTPQ